MIDLAAALPLPAIRPDPHDRDGVDSVYAGPHTTAARDWLDKLEVAHGALPRMGAELLLAMIDTRRFQLTVTTGAVTLNVSFHAGGRRTPAAQLRQDNGLVELMLQDLGEAVGHRAMRDVGARLEALAPGWFRWSRADGSLPGLELAACASEQTAANVVALLDDILVTTLRIVAARRLALAS